MDEQIGSGLFNLASPKKLKPINRRELSRKEKDISALIFNGDKSCPGIIIDTSIIGMGFICEEKLKLHKIYKIQFCNQNNKIVSIPIKINRIKETNEYYEYGGTVSLF